MASYYLLASESVQNRRKNLPPATKLSPPQKELQEEEKVKEEPVVKSPTDMVQNNYGELSSEKSLFTYNPEGFDTQIKLDLTPYEIDLIRKTWSEMIQDEGASNGNTSKVSINSITATLFCVQFYSNLIAATPELEKMFPSIKHQAISLSGVISTAIVNLDQLDKLDDYLSNLGKRHSRILGIEPEHFELMGAAMLKTFKDRFGAKFTLDLEKCWTRLFTYLSNQLLQMGIDPVMRLDVNYHTITPRSSIHGKNSHGSPHEGDNFSVASLGTRASSVSSMETQQSFARQQQQSSLSQLRQGSVSTASSFATSSKTGTGIASSTSQQNYTPPQSSGRQNHLNKIISSNKKKITNDQSSLGSSGSTEEKCSIM